METDKKLSDSMDETDNVLIEAQKERDMDTLFQISRIYKTFSEHLENINKDKKNNIVYMISKEFINNFKKNVKYEQTKELLNEDKEENLQKFKQYLKEYTYGELYSFLEADIKLYCDLDEIQEDIDKGFEFVDYNFLDKFDFEENFEDFIAHYYREKNNIFIEFDDNSKFIINQENGKTKYHVMEAPVQRIDVPPIKRTKTAFLSNRRSKTKKAMTLRHVSNSVKP